MLHFFVNSRRHNSADQLSRHCVVINAFFVLEKCMMFENCDGVILPSPVKLYSVNGAIAISESLPEVGAF